jgi:acyl-ACP thioesterase
MIKYQYNTSIKSYETDASGKVSLANLFYYFQEAANLHASSLEWGIEYLDSINKFWILSRLFIKVDYYPEHKDEITIETWSRGADGYYAYRDYKVLVNGKSCIDAVSSWMILDKSTHRPTKIDQIGKEIPKINESYLPFPEIKIPVLDSGEKNFSKQVNYSDTDINRHVNNGKYVEIITDGLSDRLMANSVITELDIQYMAESQMGDILHIFQKNSDESNSQLTLMNATKSKESCRCRIKWK